MPGFIDSRRIDELDNAIAELARAVHAKSFAVDPSWRAEWEDFAASWKRERDTYERLGARLGVKAGNKRLDAFGARFQEFDAAWESRAPFIDPPELPRTDGDAWLVLGAGALLFFLSRRR